MSYIHKFHRKPIGDEIGPQLVKIKSDRPNKTQAIKEGKEIAKFEGMRYLESYPADLEDLEPNYYGSLGPDRI